MKLKRERDRIKNNNKEDQKVQLSEKVEDLKNRFLG